MARTSTVNRNEATALVQSDIEQDMKLQELTFFKDKLQTNVRGMREKLRYTGISIWVLSGDKFDTSTNIAVCFRLPERSSGVYNITALKSIMRIFENLRVSADKQGPTYEL